MKKNIYLLLGLLLLSRIAYTQQVDEGFFNDWDFGPQSVHGNLRLTRTTARTCFKIEKNGPGRVVVKRLITSGVVVNIDTVKFQDGLLSEVDRVNQWGETYEYRIFKSQGNNVFRVTDLLRGRNIYLPCKYALYIYAGELLTETQYYDSNGDLAEDRNGVSIIRYKRYSDSIRFAERQETAYFDSHGQPVISKPVGYHKLLFEYDEQDNKRSESFADIHNEPISPPLYDVARTQYTYDADNNLILDEFHGLDGRIKLNTYGVSGTKWYYEQGYLMKIVRMDTLGNPTRSLASGDGVAIIKYEYDNAGNQTRESFYDESGKPMNNQTGVQEFARFFSAGNMLTGISYFNQLGHPCLNRDGVNKVQYVKDDKNRIVTQSNYGLNGQPLKTPVERVNMIKWDYDKFGRQILTSYWADSATRMSHWNGAYQTGTNYDEDGLVTEYYFLDQDGKPFVSEDGSSSMKLVYNADGRLEERQFLYDQQLIARKRGVTLGYGIIKYGYDASNKQNELTFWSDDQTPMDATIWYSNPMFRAHRIVMIYNGTRIVEERFFKLGAEEPFKVLDCLKNDYIGLNGMSLGRKNAENSRTF